MRLATVVRALPASGVLLHPVAVRAVLGARQRRWLDENDAEPEGPEAGEQSQGDGTTHGDTIHRVMAKRIPTALGERYRRWEESSSDRKGSGPPADYHNTLTVSRWCGPSGETNMPA